MFVASLEVADFRNYATARVDFPPGTSILIGRNGQGKTNLVEAVGYAATLGSHRVSSDAPMVRSGATQAHIRVGARRGDRGATLDLTIAPGRGTKAKLNGSALPKARDCLGLVRVVMFAPEDLALVKGDPAERRRMLDQLLVQRQPRWAGVIADLDRVLRQRAALLRSVAKRGGRPDDADVATLEVWDGQLARLGGELWSGRLDLLAAITGPFQDAYRALAGEDGSPDLQYRSSALAEDAATPADREECQRLLGAALPDRHRDEWRRGVTLTGPQRDELLISLHGHPAKGFASHGESWSLALALRMAAYTVLAGESSDGGDPVLILDDVFAELDATRRARLAEAVAGAEQVIITAAAQEDVPAGLTGATFHVEDGRVSAVPA